MCVCEREREREIIFEERERERECVANMIIAFDIHIPVLLEKNLSICKYF